jgi:hypothetical protein
LVTPVGAAANRSTVLLLLLLLLLLLVLEFSGLNEATLKHGGLHASTLFRFGRN